MLCNFGGQLSPENEVTVNLTPLEALSALVVPEGSTWTTSAVRGISSSGPRKWVYFSSSM